MLDTSTPLILPQLGPLYQALAPWAEALLRAWVGLAMVPHGLRNTFGFFPKTGIRSHNLTELAAQLDGDGYRPGKVWAPAISLTVRGPGTGSNGRRSQVSPPRTGSAPSGVRSGRKQGEAMSNGASPGGPDHSGLRSRRPDRAL